LFWLESTMIAASAESVSGRADAPAASARIERTGPAAFFEPRDCVAGDLACDEEERTIGRESFFRGRKSWVRDGWR
jgi:hypothetical protein